MGVPTVKITKAAFAANQVSPTPFPVGILAILASAATGTQNQPAGFYRDDVAYSAFGDGPLVQYASYDLAVSGNAAILQRTTCANPATYSAVTSSPGTGTSAVTTDATVLPQDTYDVILTILQGGTVGTAGILYNVSLDGGDATGPQTALGTANTILLPNGGGQIDLGAGTLATGATYQFFTERPLMGNTDLATATTALSQTRLPWEAVLADCVYGTGTISLLDTWLAGLEGNGQFHFVFLNTRMKNRPVPTAETEAAYAAAMTLLTENDTTIRACVGTDGADLTSTMTGWTQQRPTALFVAARTMQIPIGEDPAYVARGSLTGASIDLNGNPYHHDEDVFPGLDAQRLMTLRSFAAGGPQGTYVTNANVLSANGSSYVWVQNIRTMNVACQYAWQILSTQLSKGVGKKAPDPITGGVYIAEEDAQLIESLVNPVIYDATEGQVAGVLFSLSRTDDLSVTPAVCNAEIQEEQLAYLKGFNVTTTYTKSIQVPASPTST